MSADTFQPDPGYPCSDPDYSRPLPGEIVHSNQTPPVFPLLYPPIRPAADPWDVRAQRSCSHKNPLPPIPVFDGKNPRPRFF